MTRRTTRILTVLVSAIVITGCIIYWEGCAVHYIIKQAYGETCILVHRVSVEEALSDKRFNVTQQERLKLVKEIRRFGSRDLGLKVGKKYSQISHAKRQRVHTVSAAYPDRLESVSWWFPIVGRVTYKGYFSEEDAENEAVKLREKGYDTDRGRAGAFSTLGWFNDPILIHMLRWNEYSLARTLFHELAHATLWMKGNTQFNESFATFVGTEGAFLFLEDRYGIDSPEYTLAQRKTRDQEKFSEFIECLCKDLETLYESDLTRHEKLGRRQGVFTDYKRLISELDLESGTYDYFAELELNNAVILSLRRYKRDLSLFKKIYMLHDSNMKRTIEFFNDLAEQKGDPFEKMKEWMVGQILNNLVNEQ